MLALLRGINVGGHKKVPMAELRCVLTEIGLTDVRTYIASGNVAFDDGEDVEGAGDSSASSPLVTSIERAIADHFGFDVPVVLRTAAEIAAVHRASPYVADDAGKLVHVCFLDAAPTPDALAAVDPDHSPPDVFAVVGRDVYVHTPDGLGRSKLDLTRLAAKTTMRNWRTVGKLVDLAGA